MNIQSRDGGMLRQTFTGAALLSMCAAALAQVANEKTESKTDIVPTVEVFQAAHVNKFPLPAYPLAELNSGKEGWVNLGFMVDTNGKAYEAMVIKSSGNKEFEKTALKAVHDWTFEPASLNGHAIDSALEYKVVFAITNGDLGARPDFVRAYRALNTALKNKDKSAADSALSRLHVTNLYEDAYFGLAQYGYAREWGNETMQLDGLTRAVAEEKTARYLPKDAFVSALTTLFQLRLKAHDFTGVMSTWEMLQKNNADKKVLDAFRPAIDQLEHIRASGAYSIAGQIGDGSWYLGLFKKQFRIDVAEGHISEIKLRCDKKYVFFKYDPELEYKVSDKFGKCSIELVGDPGTKFKLIQS